MSELVRLAERIEALAERATPGEWKHGGEEDDSGIYIDLPQHHKAISTLFDIDWARIDDKELVCLLRNSAALLAAALRVADATQAYRNLGPDGAVELASWSNARIRLDEALATLTSHGGGR